MALHPPTPQSARHGIGLNPRRPAAWRVARARPVLLGGRTRAMSWRLSVPSEICTLNVPLMPQLQMTFACGLYDRMMALYTGEVRPEGIDLDFIAVHDPRELFDRMMGGLEFDASEMSASEYIIRRAEGDKTLVAIPVFPSRIFRHGFIAVNDRMVQKPSDLNGKRVGVQRYTMTAAIWIRGLLQHVTASIFRRSNGSKVRSRRPAHMAGWPNYPR